MNTVYQQDKNYDRKLTTEEYSCLEYLSKKALKQIYPKGGYIVVGGIGAGMKETAGSFTFNEEIHSYYTLHFSKYMYGIDGYVCTGNDYVLAVVKKKLAQNVLKTAAVAALILMVLISGYQMLHTSDIDASSRTYTPKNGQKLKTDPNHIALPGYDEIRMEAGSDTAYVALYNPESNPCYFKFIIKEKKSDEVIYESKMIPPGNAITEVKFNKRFSKGTYDITIAINTYDLKEKNELNGGDMDTQLIAVER